MKISTASNCSESLCLKDIRVVTCMCRVLFEGMLQYSSVYLERDPLRLSLARHIPDLIIKPLDVHLRTHGDDATTRRCFS